MNAPAPRSRVIKSATSGRDALIAVACAVGILTAIAIGVWALRGEQKKPSANLLTGVVTGKKFTGERESEISVGRKGLKTRETESGYLLDVKVEPGGRVYEVPVTKAVYEMRRIGDTQRFIRPRSEQR